MPKYYGSAYPANRWGKNGNCDRFYCLHDFPGGSDGKALFSLAPKSLPMVTSAMKLKDGCSLEEKL